MSAFFFSFFPFIGFKNTRRRASGRHSRLATLSNEKTSVSIEFRNKRKKGKGLENQYSIIHRERQAKNIT